MIQTAGPSSNMRVVLAIALSLYSIVNRLVIVSAEQAQASRNCMNKPSFYVQFHMRYITRSETCAWIGRNNPGLCFHEDIDGVLIGDRCPGQCPRVSGCPVQPATSKPTGAPYSVPTSPPTMSPTSPFPTVSPSQYPTMQPPSLFPSSQPILAPSGQPSLEPTTVPTLFATLYPSDTPSVGPTRFPTTSPSASPSTKPRMQPTTAPSNPPVSFNEDAEVSIGPSFGVTTAPSSSFSPNEKELEVSTAEMTLSVVNAKRLTADEAKTLTRLLSQWFCSFFRGSTSGVQRQCTTGIEFVRQKMSFNSKGVPTNMLTYKQTVTFTYNQTFVQKESSSAMLDGPAEHPDDNVEQDQIAAIGNLTPEQIAALPFRALASNLRLALNLRHYIDSLRDIEIPLEIPQVQDQITAPTAREDMTSGSKEVGLSAVATLVIGLAALFYY